ncbi:MAG: bifunctional glycogen debranching protein GlgX/4-alpha-glucanotransferase [Negativicutes bacterium]|nr:bifunctional glycogen debranching protein GlgX/4-alpha-glucanotransferase [Negativicutes bacterium]
MEQEWLWHNSHDSLFRSPFGAVSAGSSVRLRLRVASGNPPDWVSLRFWHSGHEQQVPMYFWQGEGSAQVFQAEFTAPAVPGLLWYHFAVCQRGKIYFYGNPSGQGGSGQIMGPNPPSWQITVYRQGAVTPNWFKEAVMYQIFVDRFFNGLPDGRIVNLLPGSLIHAYWDDTPFYVRDMRTGHIFAYDFFGGNLQGVLAKLPYLRELGVDVLYFNPVFESPSNHKYDIADYKKIDPMFGDNEFFRELCAKGREAGISVILDGVFSHTGSDSRYFNKEGRYSDLGAYQSPESPYYRWYRFSEYPDKYEAWWGIGTMPNVEELEPSYVNFIIDGEDSVVKHWHKLGARGWRLDVADELPDQFIKHLRTVLKEQDPESVLIGEVWEDASKKVSYDAAREYLLGDELDSVTNYPFRLALLDFILGRRDAAETQRGLMSLYENYPLENFYALMNVLGGHDVPRILTLLGEAPPPEGMTIIEQADYRLPPERRLLALTRLKLLVLWQMTFPGVPCIYYGDEAGLEGYADPFNRGTYPWGRAESELLAWYKKTVTLRKRFAVLQTGQWLPLPVGGDIYGYVRRIQGGRDVFGQPKKNNTAVVLFNRSVHEARTFSANIGEYCQDELLDMLDEGKVVRFTGGWLEITLGPLEGKLLLERTESPPAFSRACGILLHPTSLPSAFGIGDLGPEARNFVDFLADSGQKYWQILPLNPPGYGASPYACDSAFAGNPLLISPELLAEDGLLDPSDLADPPAFDPDSVEFETVKTYKQRLLRRAFAAFRQTGPPADYERFVDENAIWLKNYALFRALKDHFGGQAWNYWDLPLATRQAAELARYEQLLAEEIAYHSFGQYIFFRQWGRLKNYAGSRGVSFIGDLPIFVAQDSSDVWANQRLFALDDHGLPGTLAGVPPDYFSETGQLWGNPHYDWQAMRQDDYRWWRERLSLLFTLTDVVRIDHFRGFDSYWAVAAGEETAVHGDWLKGPGEEFFATIQHHLGNLPIIAEDLGIITRSVSRLREKFNLPGMKVLHFSFSADRYGECSADDCEDNMVIYTGTHDNDTTLGWYQNLDSKEAMCVRRYLGLDADALAGEICWRFIESAYANSASIAIVPLQDILCLGGEARMNLPGTVEGNWLWRSGKGALAADIAGRLAGLAAKYRR